MLSRRIEIRPVGVSGLIRAAAAVCLLIFLAGCQIPTKQLAAYREAFGAARQVSEDLLIDYGAAKREYNEILAQRARANPKQVPDAQRLAFDANAVTDPPADEILVRTKAWEVLGRYNEALTRLAEGRSPAEVGSAVDGLLNAVAALSADTAADIVPFAGVIKTAMSQIQRAIEVKKFADGVEAADPLIDELCGLLIRDANNFYNIRLGFRNLRYSPKTDQIADIRNRITAVLADHAAANAAGDLKAADIASEFNTLVNRLPNWKAADDLTLPAPGAKAFTAAVHSQLKTDIAAVGRLANDALAIDGNLLAYRDTITNYVRLIRAMRAAHGSLAAAAKHPTVALPPPADLVKMVVSVKQSIETYRSTR